MAKRGRKKGTTNLVIGHLFDAESMNHIESFKGASQPAVRAQMVEWLKGGARSGEKLLILWGLGEMVTITPEFETVTSPAAYDEDFFLARGGMATDDEDI